MFAEPRYVFAYDTASFYKRAWFAEFWIEHADVSRECREKSTKIWHSIIFECCLAHGFRRERSTRIHCS